MPNKEQTIMIARILGANKTELLQLWMAERIVAITQSEPDIAPAAIKLVEQSLELNQQ